MLTETPSTSVLRTRQAHHVGHFLIGVVPKSKHTHPVLVAAAIEIILEVTLIHLGLTGDES